jgi:hypothetical protein
MRSSLLIAVIISLLFVAPCFAATEHVQKEIIDFRVPSGWTLLGRANAEKLIKLQVAIKQSNVERLTVRLSFIGGHTIHLLELSQRLLRF